MSDGYLPSPLILATAMAARTTTLPIMVAAVVLPLYHPVRLAEDMVVLDIVSQGRVSYVAAIGYRPEEYDMHAVDFHRRGAIAEDHLGVLLQAKSGEPFEYEGRTVRVTPPPVTPGGPVVAWGGGSVAAARRAGRHGLDFLAQRGDPALEHAYREEAEAHGHRPGTCLLPEDDATTALFVAEDVDLAWEELGPYLMHDVTMYAALNEGAPHSASLSVGDLGRGAARRGRQPPDRHGGRGRRPGPLGPAAPAPPADRWTSPRGRVALPAHRGRRGDARRGRPVTARPDGPARRSGADRRTRDVRVGSSADPFLRMCRPGPQAGGPGDGRGRNGHLPERARGFPLFGIRCSVAERTCAKPVAGRADGGTDRMNE